MKFDDWIRANANQFWAKWYIDRGIVEPEKPESFGVAGKSGRDLKSNAAEVVRHLQPRSIS